MNYFVLIILNLLLLNSGIVYSAANNRNQNECPPAYSTCELGIEGYKNVHLIAHTHDDVGWKSTVDEFLYGKGATGVQYILGSFLIDLVLFYVCVIE